MTDEREKGYISNQPLDEAMMTDGSGDGIIAFGIIIVLSFHPEA
jgi:hypothetical protein